MSNKDEFDVDLDENAEEGFDEVSLDEETVAAEAQPAKKKSGGGLVSVIAILAVLGGGTFAAVKFFGVQLPFNIPGLTPTAQVAQPGTAPVQSEMTASADLPQDSLPPQPAVPAADDVAAQEGDMTDSDQASAESASSVLPDLGLPAETSQDTGINPPWDAAAPTTADAATSSAADAPFTVDNDNNAGGANIIDPFAASAQDVTAAVNNQDAATPVTGGANAASSGAEIIDPFAVGATPDTAGASPAAASAAPEAAAAAADPAQATRTAELEKKVADLEKSLAEADKALKKANDDLAATQKQLTEKTDALAKATADAKADVTSSTQPATKAAAPAKQETAPKAESAPVAPKKATAPAATTNRKAWVLRSAKPGVAWVSEKGSNEMRTISVGDTLSGIGKVTAITTDAQGRWVVNGTRGTINQ